ncbi:hypothetical protein C8R44DRAFT_258032 [Mycena epipterygia]|nr:hypothetical protein C8R44DRAFT_258032 [Mycena epipterygia]
MWIRLQIRAVNCLKEFVPIFNILGYSVSYVDQKNSYFLSNEILLSLAETARTNPTGFQSKWNINPQAEFSSDGVIEVGLRGLWGADEGVPSPKGDTVKSRDEAWFDKLDKP